MLAARSALASTSRREARAPSRAGVDPTPRPTGKAFESDDAFETETGTETDSAEESEEASEPHRESRGVAVRPVTSTSRASSSSSDSDWDAETARSLRGDFLFLRARETSFAKKAPAGKTKQSDAARLLAALVRERLDAAVKKSARKEKRAVAERGPDDA